MRSPRNRFALAYTGGASSIKSSRRALAFWREAAELLRAVCHWTDHGETAGCTGGDASSRLSHRRLGGAPRWLPRGDFEPMVSGRTIFSSFALGQDRRVQETHRYKAESHAIMSAATELFRAGAQLPEEKTGSPRRDDLATVKLRAITEVRRDST